MANQARYKIIQQIGDGGFSTVYRAQRVDEVTATKVIVAVKKIKISAKKSFYQSRMLRSEANSSKQHSLTIAEIQNEVQVFKTLSVNPFVLRLLEAFKLKGKKEYWIVTEVALGDLHNLIKNSKKLPMNQKKQRCLSIRLARHLFAPIVDALQFMHRQGYVHRDVKEDNVLLTAGGVPKLSDFGSAVAFKSLPLLPSKTGPMGSFFYMSPEVLRLEPYTLSCDTWSLGISLISVVFGGTPFSLQGNFDLKRLHSFLAKKTSEQDKAHAENSKRVSAQNRLYRLASLSKKPIASIDEQQWEDFSAFVKSLLILDKDNRKDMADIRKDPWIQDRTDEWLSFIDDNPGGEDFTADLSETQRIFCE